MLSDTDQTPDFLDSSSLIQRTPGRDLGKPTQDLDQCGKDLDLEQCIESQNLQNHELDNTTEMSGQLKETELCKQPNILEQCKEDMEPELTNQNHEHTEWKQESEQCERNQELAQFALNSDPLWCEQKVEPQPCDQDGSIPALIVTQADEALGLQTGQSEEAESLKTQEDSVPTDASPDASSSDATDMNASDLLSLRSDTMSLFSDTAVSGKSEEQGSPEEDTRSVTASSVMSLFQRLQMDPLEREWTRCAALGNISGLRQLLQQDPTLASKKDFVTTALHWAAKQGCAETADMMARAGADVNLRSGYTPLHLASLHGHAHIIQLLINSYNAKVNIRDYHGKVASHYWNGSTDIFIRPGFQSGGKWSSGRRAQRYAQLSSLLSRSRSQGHISLELVTTPLELSVIGRNSPVFRSNER